MKAIAFAIICAAYLLLPNSEAKLMGQAWGAINVCVWMICVVGFWVCIVLEK